MPPDGDHERGRAPDARQGVGEVIARLLAERTQIAFDVVADTAGVSKRYLLSKEELRERIQFLSDCENGLGALRVRAIIPHRKSWEHILALTPDASMLLAATEDGALTAWDLHPDGPQQRWSFQSEDPISRLRVSADGASLLTCAFRCMQTRKAENGAQLFTLRGPGVGLQALPGFDATPSLTRAVTYGKNGFTLACWDLAAGRVVHEALEGHTRLISSMSITPDGETFISGCSSSEPHISPGGFVDLGPVDPALRVWDFATGNCRRVLHGHKLGVSEICVSPDGALAASAGEDGTARVWDLESGECLRCFDVYSQPVLQVRFTPDGKRLITTDGEAVRVWDLERPRDVLTLRHPDNQYGGALIGIMSGGLRAATESGQTLCVWNLENGRCVARWKNPIQYRFCAVTAGRCIALASINGSDILVLSLQE
ncbi:MAG: WD40 repeat domain-containing protein [Armatimonadota bacterium]